MMMMMMMMMSDDDDNHPNRKSEPVGYSTSVVGDLKSGLPRTNQASGQGGTWNRGFWINNPAL